MKIESKPLVTDAPWFSVPTCVRLLYRMPGYGDNDSIDVIGDPDNGWYEWAIRDGSGRIVQHSDSGYGTTIAAMREGLIAYEK